MLNEHAALLFSESVISQPPLFDKRKALPLREGFFVTSFFFRGLGLALFVEFFKFPEFFRALRIGLLAANKHGVPNVLLS